MLACVTLLATAAAAADGAGPQDPQIEALIARMTPEEKAGQLTLVAAALDHEPADAGRAPGAPTALERQLAEIREGRIGAVFNGVGARWARQLQRAAVEQSRLKIPLLIAADAIHGFRTIFPVPLAEAASFEPQLAERSARMTAREAAAAGVAWNLAPVVDVARDARWGRGVEGAGEDVLLNRRFAAARVRGYQGAALSDDDAVLATAKHFAAYGAAEGGLDYNTVELTERTLREVYLPPFRAALDVGALAVMAAFHDIAGLPMMVNRWLLTDVLRGEWAYRGIVVSDYAADHELVAHGVARDAREAVKLAFLAGVDVSMTSRLYQQHLPELLRSGEVPSARLDEAVRRMLTVKKKLGLFDAPYGRMSERRERERNHTAEARALAREVAQRSMVLLKNEGGLLPLHPGQRIALIGPFARQGHLNGPWTLFDDRRDAVSLEAGLRAALRDPALLTVVPGCEPESPIEGGIEAAVAAARAADVVLLAIGETESMTGEAQSRSEIVVPAPQQALAEAVAAAGKPVVVLLRTGRALALQGAVRGAQAILVTWFLGLETGNAVSDVLLGRVSPSGRLPVSFPQAPGQVPYYYARRNTGRPAAAGAFQEYTARYRGISARPLYPFGHGLTYSTIRYDSLELSPARLPWDEPLRLRARLTNTGTREVEEVVQLYLRDRVASLARPLRELKDFRKLALAPGRTAEVEFTLRREDLTFIGLDNRPVVEPGEFEVWVGPSAQEGLMQVFELVAQ